MPSQQERKNETRVRLLEAAAIEFASKGVEAAGVDAIAERAGRTSGAIYAHFGSKEGLLLELLESWRTEVSAAVLQDLVGATTLDERLGAMWRNFTDPAGEVAQWVRLEHELWRWTTSTGHDDARERLRGRYTGVWSDLAEIIAEWVGPPVDGFDAKITAVTMIGLLIGLEMQHRLAPDVVDEVVAVAGLKALLPPRLS